MKRVAELRRLVGETSLDAAIEADVHPHWIKDILPEEVMRIRKGIRWNRTDDVLVYNSSYGIIEIAYREQVHGEWNWVHGEGSVSHWMLMPLNPDEVSEESRVEGRRRAEELL